MVTNFLIAFYSYSLVLCLSVGLLGCLPVCLREINSKALEKSARIFVSDQITVTNGRQYVEL